MTHVRPLPDWLPPELKEALGRLHVAQARYDEASELEAAIATATPLQAHRYWGRFGGGGPMNPGVDQP